MKAVDRRKRDLGTLLDRGGGLDYTFFAFEDSTVVLVPAFTSKNLVSAPRGTAPDSIAMTSQGSIVCVGETVRTALQ